MSRNRLCNIPSWKMELQVSHLAWFQMTVFPSEAIKVTESSGFSVMPSAAVSGELCTSGHLSHAVPGRGRPRLCPCRGRWGQQSPVPCPSPEPASRAAASPQTPRVTATDTAGSGARELGVTDSRRERGEQQFEDRGVRACGTHH